jgi:hypothetical protein
MSDGAFSAPLRCLLLYSYSQTIRARSAGGVIQVMLFLCKIVMTDEVANRTDVVVYLFGERQRAAHQPLDSLAERIVEPDLSELAPIGSEMLQ